MVHISKGFKLVIYSLAVFFTFLAVLDGYRDHEIIYDDVERIDEAEFDFLEITQQITRPSFRKVNKFERIQAVSILNRLFTWAGIEPELHFFQKANYFINYTFTNYLISYSNYTNAP